MHLTPVADGVLFLGVEVTLKHDQTDEARTFSIPIIVAPQKDAALPAKPDTTLAAKH